jgi:hypothetical protein
MFRPGVGCAHGSRLRPFTSLSTTLRGPNRLTA